jgi:hypothetical protein
MRSQNYGDGVSAGSLRGGKIGQNRFAAVDYPSYLAHYLRKNSTHFKQNPRDMRQLEVFRNRPQ